MEQIKNEYDERKAEILWGQAANLLAVIQGANFGNALEHEPTLQNNYRTRIFKWLWETRNDYRKIFETERNIKQTAKEESILDEDLEIQNEADIKESELK